MEALHINDTPSTPQANPLEAYGQELMSTGVLSDESRAQIKAAHSLDDNTIDIFVAGVKAQQAQAAAEAADVVGGQETLQSILTWAETNLTQAEKDAVNAQLANSATAETTLLGLKARMAASNPTTGEPATNVDTTPGGSTGTVQPFASGRERNAHIRDPRYEVDPEFTDYVNKRLMAGTTIKRGGQTSHFSAG